MTHACFQNNRAFFFTQFQVESPEGIELPSITSIPGAADLVNNIIDGVLGPDEADASAVSDDAGELK